MNSKDKIGILVCSLHIRSGISRAVVTICQYFKNKIVIFTDKCNKVISQEIPRDTVISEIYPRRILTLAPPLKLISLTLTLWKTLTKEKNIKILNPHGIYELLISCATKLLFIPRKIKISWLIYDEEEILRRHPLLKTTIQIFIKLKVIDQILVLDNRIKRLVRQEFKSKDVHTIRIGVNLNIMKLYERFRKSPQKKSNRLCKLLNKHSEKIVTLYFHGILIPRRRVEDLLKSVAILKDEFHGKKLILYISGSTSFDRHYFNKLERVTKSLELTPNVKFLNSLSEEELAYMYKLSDIFIFPCDKQTWGIAPLEAMLFEKPVIVSSGTGVSEVLRDENVAVIVPPKNPKKLAEAIRVLIRNKRLRKKLGMDANRFVKRHLTFVQTGEQLKKVWGLSSNNF